MQTIFEVDGLCAWDETYDHSNAEAIGGTITVETKIRVHSITFTGLSDYRAFNEIFRSTPSIRVLYDGSLEPPYLLELREVKFALTSCEVQTRSKRKSPH